MGEIKDWEIGYKHLTKYGSVLTVTGKYAKKIGQQKKAMLIVSCSECSKDTELWPEGSIRGLKCNIAKGHTPCGCGKSAGNYTEKQREILFSRAGLKVNYKFHSLTDQRHIANYSCNICCKDTEMYPEGSIQMSVHNIERGQLSCGCSKKTNFTEAQRILMINRKLKDFPKEFIGWENGDYIKGKSKPLVKCLLSGVVKTFHTTDSLLLSRDTTLNNPFHEHPLKTVYFTKAGGTLKPLYFTGNMLGNNKEVAVVCSRCSKDFELFPEPFTTTPSKLQEGNFPCICDNFKMWTDHEYLVKLDRYAKRNNFTDLSVQDEGKVQASTRVRFTCDKRHRNIKSVDRIFNSTNGCPKCASGYLGHYPFRESEKDYLYIIQFNNDYIKVGRSFEVDRRYRELVIASEAKDVKVLHTFTGTHSEVFTVEQYLHSTLESAGYYHHESKWTIESFHKEALQLTLGLIGYTVLEEIK